MKQSFVNNENAFVIKEREEEEKKEKQEQHET